MTFQDTVRHTFPGTGATYKTALSERNFILLIIYSHVLLRTYRGSSNLAESMTCSNVIYGVMHIKSLLMKSFVALTSSCHAHICVASGSSFLASGNLCNYFETFQTSFFPLRLLYSFLSVKMQFFIVPFQDVTFLKGIFYLIIEVTYHRSISEFKLSLAGSILPFCTTCTQRKL